MANTLDQVSGRPMPVDLDQQFDHFLDALRREQVTFLDSMRSLCMPLGPGSGALAAAASSQARLTQQFLDAQRSLLRRTAEFDTAANDIERAAGEDARQMVIGAANYALDCGVPSETLDELRWTALDAAPPVDVDAEADRAEVARCQQRELSDLLDRWWAETQTRGSASVDRANSFAGLVRGRADERVTQILEAVARHAAPHSSEAPTDPSSLMPTDLLAAFETADSRDLGGLLDSLLVSLGAAHATTPTALAPSDDVAPDAGFEITQLLEALDAEVELAAVEPAVLQADSAIIQLGQRPVEPPMPAAAAEIPAATAASEVDFDEPAGPWAVFTRVLMPMLLAVGTAVALLAWMG